jgi:hypothetical protein
MIWILVYHHHASLLKSSIKQIVCFGAWDVWALMIHAVESYPKVVCTSVDYSISLCLHCSFLRPCFGKQSRVCHAVKHALRLVVGCMPTHHSTPSCCRHCPLAMCMRQHLLHEHSVCCDGPPSSQALSWLLRACHAAPGPTAAQVVRIAACSLFVHSPHRASCARKSTAAE